MVDVFGANLVHGRKIDVVHSNNNNNDRSITVGLNYAVFSLAMLIMDV